MRAATCRWCQLPARVAVGFLLSGGVGGWRNPKTVRATRRLAGCGEEGQAGRDVRRQTLMQDQRGGVTYMRRDFMSESAKRLNYLAQS